VRNGVRSTKSNFLNGSAHHHSDFLNTVRLLSTYRRKQLAIAEVIE
jgi:hypothetical protein